MSTTVEKVVGARRSRLARIDQAIEKDEAALEAARRKLVELAAAEDEAVRESKRKEPSESPYKLRSPAQMIREEAEKLERSLDGIERGLAALKAERVAADAEQAARELAERTEEARNLTAKEREARLAAAKAFVALAERWNALADVLSQRSVVRTEVARDQLLHRVGLFDRAVIASWEEVADYLVSPVPTTLVGFIDETIEAALGERTDVEAEHEAVREINRRRRALAARNPGGGDDLPMIPLPVIAEDPLHELVPDLRGEVREAAVNGVEVRRSTMPEPTPWPGAA
jgi:hypothetical protein